VGGRLAILAAAWTALVPLPATAADDRGEPVVFVAWNVRNFTLQDRKDAAGRIATPAKDPRSVDRIVETLAALEPDIVGLCEIGSRRDLAALQSRLRRAGTDLPHAVWVDGADAERHLALLSRFPVTSEQHETDASFLLNGILRRVQRGFLDCTIAVRPDFPLRVLGAHLKSRRIVPEFDQAEFRRHESILLRRRIERILDDDRAARLLVFGDFNDTKDSPVVAGLLGRAGSPAALGLLPLADGAGDSWTYHWDETDEYSRVDYVMVSRALRPLVDRRRSRVHRTTGWRTASDHRPLVVILRIPSQQSRP
jgi:endonuclease/exonuclease/phosphatase family metal-dependent hydrolase